MQNWTLSTFSNETPCIFYVHDVYALKKGGEKGRKWKKKNVQFFFGCDRIRTRNFDVTGGVGQITAICVAKMLPLDHGNFFTEEA